MLAVTNYLVGKGVLRAFKGQLIHTFNKREGALSHAAHFTGLQGRQNVLLLGDSLGDLTMADGVSEPRNILTIGFLNDQVRPAVSTGLMCQVNPGSLGSAHTVVEMFVTLFVVSLRWTRGESRTSTPSTSCWWRTRRWTFQTPSSDTSPLRETISKKHWKEPETKLHRL